MAMTWPLIGIAITIVLMVFVVAFVLKMKKNKWQRTIDYRNYFTMGLIWLPFGMVVAYLFRESVIGLVFAAMGAVYLAIGLKNKDKWGKPQRISAAANKIMITLLAAGIILLALGFIAFMLWSYM